MIPKFQSRDFENITQPNVTWSVDSMEWDTNGGPRQCQLTPAGGDNALFSLANMLRCPVTIHDDRGQAAWWGYVSEVHVAKAGAAIGVGYSLDNMANNVACTYSFIEAGGTVVGKRKTTEYSAYAYGTAEYGQRDYMVSVDGMSDASGTLVRNLYLQQHQVPPGVAEIGGQLSVICRGWWDTMDWRMASNTGTAGTAITSKLRGLVTSYGQFLAGAILETTNSGTLTSYFSGDNTAREEADKLMEMGGANGRQINVMVDENRLAIFSEEPAQPTGGTAAYSLDARGRLYDASGGRVLPHMAWRAVGQYVQLKDVVGATTDTTLLQDPSIQYLEGISWRAGGEIMPEFRGEVNARDIVRAKA